MMNFDPENLQFPLKERIGTPELLAGRASEFQNYHQWINGIPKEISKSRVIISRKKSGKTVFLQRLFNEMWSAQGEVVPFYMEILERKVWFPDFATDYFETFATQYISFLEHDPKLLKRNMSLEAIKAFGEQHSLSYFVDDVDQISSMLANGRYDAIWKIAFTAPHRYADFYEKSAVVMLDEFQNLNGFIYVDPEKKILDETIPGSYHEVSESKIAPMLVTGSNVQWLLQVIRQYFQMGRLQRVNFSPFLKKEEGLEAVYRLSENLEIPISNEVAVAINETCMADPYFISSIFRSSYEPQDLSTIEALNAIIHHEVGTVFGEIAQEWYGYFEKTVSRINEHHAKTMLLFLCKHSHQAFTPQQVKEKLGLELDVQDIKGKLETMREVDLIQGSVLSNQYQGLDDGTFHLALQVRLQAEIDQFDPELVENADTRLARMRAKNKSLQGALNQSEGMLAEYQLAFELLSHRKFSWNFYFEGLEEGAKLFQVNAVKRRFFIQSGNHPKQELDLRVVGNLEHEGNLVPQTMLIEVKKMKTPVDLRTVETFWEKVAFYQTAYPGAPTLQAFVALGGFTADALAFCKKYHIGTTNQLHYHQTEWTV